MKNTRKTLRIVWCSAVMALTAMIPQETKAAPYATSLTNNSGVISFRLNEAANSVAVIFTNLSGTLVTSNLGPKTLGLTVTNLFVPGNFTISVTNSANPGYVSGTVLQVSADGTNGTATNTLRFPTPRGVAVNKNPGSPYFGRIYVANATGGAATRAVGAGLYALNGDYSDAVGQGTNSRTAGIPDLALNNGNTPWRLEVGEDSQLYVSGFTTGRSNLYVVDPNLLTGTNVLAGGNGRIPSSVIAKGSLAGGDLVLYAMDSDYTATSDNKLNHIIKYPIGAGPLPFSLTQTNVTIDTNTLESITNIVNLATNVDNLAVLNIAGVTVDLAAGPDGKFYPAQNRSDGFEGGVFVVDPAVDGGPFNPVPDGLWDYVYDSRSDSIGNYGQTVDLLRQTRGVTISPDGQYMALIRDDNLIWVIKLVNGIPDLSTRKSLATSPNTTIGRDITFDAANNIYTVSSGQAVLRAYSPGYRSIAQTSSQGTFTFTNILPSTTVTIAATVPSATEDINDPLGTNAPGVFTFTREGDVSQPLTVNYAISGTATRALDYATNGLGGIIPVINGLVTFAAGESTTNIFIAVRDDSLGEATETVIFTITGSTNYLVGGTGAATIQIFDDGDLPAVSITNLGGSYSLLPGRPAKFKLSMPIAYISDLTVNISLSGTAASGVDYADSPTFSVLIKQGIISTNFTVTPLGNSLTNAKTIVATVLPGAGYTNDIIISATNVLRPDYLVPGAVVFSDNFDTDTSASWAAKLFSGTNSDATFSYDYSLIGVPSAPHSTGGSTKGLRLRARIAGTNNANEGISVSPIGKSFTNDYRLRFDLWMNYNGPLPGGGGGSSEFFTTGLGVSEARTNITTVAALPGSSVIFAVDGDGGFGEATGDYIVSTNGTAIASTNIYWAGARDNFAGYYSEFGELPAPAAQVALYPGPTAGANQTGLGQIGSLSFAWHDVVMTKSGTVYTWIVDGLTIASINYGTATVGTNISFGYQDINTSVMDNILVNNAIVDNVTVERIISTNSLLANLAISSTTLSPAFAPGTASYAATNAFASSPVTVTATAAGSTAASLRLSVNGGSLIALTNGVGSIPQALSLNPNTNTLSVRVVSEDGLSTNFYSALITLLPSQTPPVITNSYDGSAVTFTWPTSHVGYRLLAQTNTLGAGLGTNWFPVAGASVTNKVVIPVNAANPTVFYKLVYP
jgi:hypothetical protein